MHALNADRLPTRWLSLAGLLLHRRAGLAASQDMPCIERAVVQARIDLDWLGRYGTCTGSVAGRDGTLPPLALQVAAVPLHLAIMADRAFPFRALGLVHQSQRVAQWRALDPTAAYDLRAYTCGAREERRGTSFALVTEAHQDGALVWRADIRALALTRSPVEADRLPRRDADLEGLEPVSSETIEVPESMGRRYARIAGDINPVHVHAWLARPFGFRRAIAHGTWTLARALASAGLPGVPVFALEARFRRPVELPSRMLVTRYAGSSGALAWLQVSDPSGGHTRLEARLTLAKPAAPASTAMTIVPSERDGPWTPDPGPGR